MPHPIHTSALSDFHSAEVVQARQKVLPEALVARVGLGPVQGFEAHVGRRTDVRFVSSSLWRGRRRT